MGSLQRKRKSEIANENLRLFKKIQTIQKQPSNIITVPAAGDDFGRLSPRVLMNPTNISRASSKRENKFDNNISLKPDLGENKTQSKKVKSSSIIIRNAYHDNS